MARVLALGGCGGVGRYALPVLLDDPDITEVVLADRDGDAAHRQAAAYGPRVVPLQVDVTDAGALRDAVARADVVMNTVGPFYRFGVPILAAVIEAGRAYVDVCDDGAPTLEMLALDGRARARGVCALVGMGISPGVSNLLAVLAVGELDRARAVVTGWDIDAALPERIGPEPSAATLHGVHQLTGRIRVRRDGRWSDERPIRPVDIDYPGLGVRRAWTIGHPEPVTLPRTFPDLDDCLDVMVTSPANALAMRALRGLVDRGLLGERRAAWLAERVEGEGGRTPTLAEVLAEAERRGRLGLPPIFAVAEGTRAGQPAAVGVMLRSAPAGGLGGTTGVPLAIAAGMLASGELAASGVHSPEALVDPRGFLDRLAPLCDPPVADGEGLVIVTRSWEEEDLWEVLRGVTS